MYWGDIKKRVGVALHVPLLTRYQNPGSTSARTGMRQESLDAVYRYCPSAMYDLFDDFDQDAAITGEPESPYTQGAGTAVITKGARCGIMGLATTSATSQQIAGYYRRDYTILDAQYGAKFMCRFQIPTDLAANQRIVIGVAGALNIPFDLITRYAWVKLNASMAVTCEANDGTTVSLAQATNSTLVSGSGLGNFYTVSIYFDAGKVYFLLADDRGGSQQQLISGGLTYAPDTTYLQPFVMVMKDSGTGVPSLNLDFVRAGCRRV